MARKQRVERPLKKSEYAIQFGSASAEKGWMDLCATIRNAMVDTWDFLTRTPLQRTDTNYPLRGELANITRNGSTVRRWQHKPTFKGDARIWFYVDAQVVVLEQVHTHHSNQTK